MRDRILRFVLGDSTIHIKNVTEYDLEAILRSSSENMDGTAPKGGLCSSFCVAEKSEQEVYNEANRSSGEVQAIEDLNDIPTNKERHHKCLMFDRKQSQMSITEFQARRLTFGKDLSALAVCRQLYEESHSILWQTNVFSFHDPQSFQLFIAGMNPTQKRKLTKIHISMKVLINDKNDRCAEWARVLVPRVLKPLTTLKVLHLSLDQCVEFSQWFHVECSHEESQLHVSHCMDQLVGLRSLPWKNEWNLSRGKHITVVISDDASTHSQDLTSRWTKAQKLEAAEKLRARLAAPDSAQIHEAEVAAAKVAKAEAAQRYREKQGRAYVRRLQHCIDDLKIELDGAKEMVEDCSRMRDFPSLPKRQWNFRDRELKKLKARHQKLTDHMWRLESDMKEILKDPENPEGKKPPSDSGNIYFSD